MIEVIDQGPGVPEDLDLFAAFTQVDQDSPGIGLGLHIVQTLVTAMGGTVTAHRNDDVGSTFRVTLPRAD